MDAMQVRRVAPVVYGLVAVILWIVAPGAVALIFSIVGAMALGLMYVLSGKQIEADGLGRQRNRNRNRRQG